MSYKCSEHVDADPDFVYFKKHIVALTSRIIDIISAHFHEFRPPAISCEYNIGRSVTFKGSFAEFRQSFVGSIPIDTFSIVLSDDTSGISLVVSKDSPSYPKYGISVSTDDHVLSDEILTNIIDALSCIDNVDAPNDSDVQTVRLVPGSVVSSNVSTSDSERLYQEQQTQEDQLFQKTENRKTNWVAIIVGFIGFAGVLLTYFLMK